MSGQKKGRRFNRICLAAQQGFADFASTSAVLLLEAQEEGIVRILDSSEFSRICLLQTRLSPPSRRLRAHTPRPTAPSC